MHQLHKPRCIVHPLQYSFKMIRYQLLTSLAVLHKNEKPAIFLEHISKRNSSLLCHKCPTHLGHSAPPIKP